MREGDAGNASGAGVEDEHAGSCYAITQDHARPMDERIRR